MTCHEHKAALGAWLDQALEAEAAAATERHLAHCAACRVELERLRAVQTALQSVTPPLPAASLDARVLASFRQQHTLQKTGEVQPRGWRAWVFGSLSVPKPALALAVLGVLGAVVLSYKIGEVLGAQLPLTPPPVLVYHQTTKRTLPSEAERAVNVKTLGNCTRPARATGQHQLAKLKNKQPAARFETQASASEAGVDFMTTAPLGNFEPVKDPAVRIIKGGSQ